MKRKRYPKNFKEQLIVEAQEVGNTLSCSCPRYLASNKSMPILLSNYMVVTVNGND